MAARRFNCEQALDMIFADPDSEGVNVPVALGDNDQSPTRTSDYITMIERTAMTQLPIILSDKIQVQSVCAVPCNERYHTLKNYKQCHLDR